MVDKKTQKYNGRVTIVVSQEVDELLRIVRAKLLLKSRNAPSHSKLIDTLLYQSLKFKNPAEVADLVIANVRKQK